MAPIDTAPEIVCDAGPLIHLEELGCIDLLSDFDRVWVPTQVWNEVARHRPEALASESLRCVDIEVSTDGVFQTLVRALALDLGEQAAPSHMRTRPKAILLTDDAAARMASVAMAVLRILRSIPSLSTLHIRAEFLAEIVEEVESQQ